MSTQADLLGAFETHSPAEIRKALEGGISPVDLIGGKRPIDCLIEMYSRSTQFAACIQVMLDAGATIGDPLLESLLMDNDSALRQLLDESKEGIGKRLSPLCAYTSCRGVTPLHICAEFNSIHCARLLLERGADVNAKADLDALGMGGHTPVFHAVNSNSNYCRPVMEMLIEAGADLDIRVKILLWGESMTWETLVYDVTPISYAQCGLYRQFHRPESDVYSNIAYLWRKRWGTDPPVRNVPNQYLVLGY